MKTKEELNALKEEMETLSKKLAELNEEEMKQVTGGAYEGGDICFLCGGKLEFTVHTSGGVSWYHCTGCGKTLIYDPNTGIWQAR